MNSYHSVRGNLKTMLNVKGKNFKRVGNSRHDRGQVTQTRQRAGNSNKKEGR